MKAKKQIFQSVVMIVGAVVFGFSIGLYAAYNFIMYKVSLNVDTVIETTISQVYDTVDYGDRELVEKIMKDVARENIQKVLMEGVGTKTSKSNEREIFYEGVGSKTTKSNEREIFYEGVGSKTTKSTEREIMYEGVGSKTSTSSDREI